MQGRGGRAHCEVWNLVIALLLAHDREQQINVVAERRDSQHPACIVCQVIREQLHSKLDVNRYYEMLPAKQHSLAGIAKP